MVVLIIMGALISVRSPNNEWAVQGKSTPEHKSPGMGHFPINDIKSIASRESVSLN